jgi:hypothetical protein
MGCTLSAYGTGFDVDSFLRTSSLEVDDVWHEGEPMGSGGGVKKSSGLTIEILDNELDNLRAQTEAAVTFLRANREELERLATAASGHWFTLQFGVRLREDIVVWVDAIPPELSRHAGEVGCMITISHYPSLERERTLFETEGS